MAKPCCALIVFLATQTVGYSTLPVRVSPWATGNVSEDVSSSRETGQDQVYRSTLKGWCLRDFDLDILALAPFVFSIDMIFNSKNVFMGNKNSDITELIIDEINNKI